MEGKLKGKKTTSSCCVGCSLSNDRLEATSIPLSRLSLMIKGRHFKSFLPRHKESSKGNFAKLLLLIGFLSLKKKLN